MTPLIIDFHTHCFPDALAAKALPKLSEHSGAKYYVDGTARGLRESMQKNGIDAGVLLQIATRPAQTPTVNAWAIEQNSSDIIAFGSVHPEYPHWKDELDRLADAGIKGIKLHPEYQEFDVNAPRVIPIYEHAFSRGLTIVFHAGIDIGFPDTLHAPPERFLAAYDTFKHGNVVLSHMGGWKMWDEVLSQLVGTSFYFDTSFCVGYIQPEQMKTIILKHGADKILFGSDTPWEDQAASLELVRGLNLGMDAEALILGENARRLLRI